MRQRKTRTTWNAVPQICTRPLQGQPH